MTDFECDDGLIAWVQSVRAELETEFRPRGQRALSQWPVSLSTADWAGVPCQIITPKHGATGCRLLYFFGGGYVSGDPDYDLGITAALAALTGASVVAPRYSLAPEYHFPQALDQGFGVLKELQTARAPLIGVAGESAGAGLALAMTHMCGENRLRMPHSLALFSPWADLTPQASGSCRTQDDPTLTAHDLPRFARATLQGADPSDARASPGLASIPDDWPPTYLSTGTRDCLRPIVRALHRKITQAGRQSTMFDAPGMWHVFELYDETPHALDSLHQAAEHLKTHAPQPKGYP